VGLAFLILFGPAEGGTFLVKGFNEFPVSMEGKIFGASHSSVIGEHTNFYAPKIFNMMNFSSAVGFDVHG
jgi:hypothetical protein